MLTQKEKPIYQLFKDLEVLCSATQELKKSKSVEYQENNTKSLYIRTFDN